jgi:hypothetical protein
LRPWLNRRLTRHSEARQQDGANGGVEQARCRQRHTTAPAGLPQRAEELVCRAWPRLESSEEQDRPDCFVGGREPTVERRYLSRRKKRISIVQGCSGRASDLARRKDVLNESGAAGHSST